jgi:cell division protein ZapA (FtsZ GTPase activity inhibitor)
MATYLTDFITALRYLIKDSVATYDFSDTEVQAVITHVLKEISARSPYIAKETALVTANSKLLDISGISNLITIKYPEWEVGADPPNYRNFKREDNETISMIVDSAPSTTGSSGTLTGTVTFTAGSATVTGSGTAFLTELAQNYYICVSDGTRWYRVYSVESDTSLTLDETVKTADTGADTINTTKYRYNVAVIHCEKLHTLTDAVKTLNSKEESVLSEGVMAYLLSQWVNKLRSQVNEAVTIISTLNSTTDDMSDRITKAISDIANGRSLVGKYQSQTQSAIDDITFRINKAISDISNARGSIGEKKAEALTAIADASSRIDKAISDLNTGRPQIDDERDTAKQSLDDVSTRLDKAIADLSKGEEYINTIPIGNSPESAYMNKAGRELQAANTLMSQGQAYLSQSSSSLKFSEYAGRELSVCNSLLSQANSYLNVDQINSEHLNAASREFQAINAHLTQARGYIDMENPSNSLNLAAREFGSVQSLLTQVSGYAREIQSRLNIASIIANAQGKADRQMQIYKQRLNEITPLETASSHSSG